MSKPLSLHNLHVEGVLYIFLGRSLTRCTHSEAQVRARENKMAMFMYKLTQEVTTLVLKVSLVIA